MQARRIDREWAAQRGDSPLHSPGIHNHEAAGAGVVKLSIDGIAVEVPERTTLWEAARTAGVEIPVLCHEPRMRPVMREMDWNSQRRLFDEIVLSASCRRRPVPIPNQITTPSPQNAA